MARRSALQVAGSRAQTLDAAVELASVVGLEGLTIGSIADATGIPLDARMAALSQEVRDTLHLERFLAGS